MRVLPTVAGLAVIGAVLLCLPPRDGEPPPAPARGGAFAWDRDAYWRALERRFVAARAEGCANVAPRTAREIAALDSRIRALGTRPLAADDSALDALDRADFELGTDIAACPEHEREYLALLPRLRDMVKAQSERWDPMALATRRRLYVSLYGARAASEEVLIQHPDSALALYVSPSAPSATPEVAVRGVTIHSGDILVSRGGYPTSALIARGNDYPG